MIYRRSHPAFATTFDRVVEHMLHCYRMPRVVIVSAGFVEFGAGGVPTCFGMSESLNIASREDDSEALAKQLGLMTANG